MAPAGVEQGRPHHPDVIRLLLNSLLYFPTREHLARPEDLGLSANELWLDTDDGERLHGWWVPASAERQRGHLLFCHGNGGNVGDRLENARLLADAGLDVLLFDYRGYGRSSGRPSEAGTHRDARAARRALLDRPGVDPARVLYLGESLGGAVALALAVEAPPRGLVLHGDSDEVVPASQGRALFDAARVPKRLELLPGVGHNDLVSGARRAYVEAMTSWIDGLGEPWGQAR